ncbi:unnamed protein product [Rotaria sp. Silwood2]|nr:unnamed protein product [Rotaria sp. Silwood2]CAF4305531.1 unnamed protein product [Rotaria sp. Silwood2]
MDDNNTRSKSVDFNDASLAKVKQVNKIHSVSNPCIQSSLRRPDENTSSSVQRSINIGTVRVSRIKSSTKKKLDTLNNESVQQHQEISVVDSIDAVRVTHVPSPLTRVHSTSIHICHSSIIENTIRLDEHIETRSSIGLSKKNEDRVHVKRIRSNHRTSAFEYRSSQMNAIKLSSLNNVLEHETMSQLSSVRIEHVHRKKKKSKLVGSVVPFESISKETTNKREGQHEQSIKFALVVERIPRQKSAKSIN